MQIRYNNFMKKILLVFALQSECQDKFDGFEKIITGVGACAASYALTKYLYTHEKPDLVINLGTAGASKASNLKAGSLVFPTIFCCRDENVDLNINTTQYLFSDHQEKLTSNDNCNLQKIFSGNTFYKKSKLNLFSKDKYHIVDMESYFLAEICAKEHIDFKCIKYISDSCSTKQFKDNVNNSATRLRYALDTLI
jgi:adenosylhomocysteine nucleosidase